MQVYGLISIGYNPFGQSAPNLVAAPPANINSADGSGFYCL